MVVQTHTTTNSGKTPITIYSLAQTNNLKCIYCILCTTSKWGLICTREIIWSSMSKFIKLYKEWFLFMLKLHIHSGHSLDINSNITKSYSRFCISLANLIKYFSIYYNHSYIAINHESMAQICIKLYNFFFLCTKHILN